MEQPYHRTRQLLAVDLGLKTGLALYGGDGRLVWYRSRHFGNSAQLRRRMYSLFDELPDVRAIVMEGGGPIADAWIREAARRGIEVSRISAEKWRTAFFYPRDIRTSALAKRSAGALARQVIEWSGADRPTSLRHDAAEAILIGLWGVLHGGWLAERPPFLRPGGAGS